MLTWQEFTEAEPALASAGATLLQPEAVGLGFLATTRPDGGPRVHPICPLVTSDGLFGFIVPGPKLNDLRRDPRYALHSETFPPPKEDDAFYITGVVRESDDPALRRRLTSQFLAEREWLDEPPSRFEDQPLIEFLLASCLLTLTQSSAGLPAGHSIWRADGTV
jgi:hypothetical protein